MDCLVKNCVSCNSNNALVCNKCEDKYFIKAGFCTKCEDPHCIECENENQCTKCEPHYYIRDGKCAECIDHCLECEEHDCQGNPECVPIDCTKCENGYYFSPRDNYKCVYTGILNCADYEYPEKDGEYKCADCENGYGLEENCTGCFKSDDPNCIMCDQGLKFCSNFTFWKNGKCLEGCQVPNCESCNPYNVEDCLYCKYGYELYEVDRIHYVGRSRKAYFIFFIGQIN